ncbi:MAG: hypothetical protein IJ106_12585 [Parasporobacterium sp.]|nr:hypothetical protein [Parasporobacterium sp.]
MRSIEISNIKKFTAELFAGERFDRLLTAEVQISTAATFSINGYLNDVFLGEEEMQLPENREGMIRWKKLRPICFEIIKGKKVPQQFKIVFKMPLDMVRSFLKETGCAFSAEQISGLFLNLHFRDNQMYCTTGSALQTFSMDKSLDHLWDDYMEAQLKEYR